MVELVDPLISIITKTLWKHMNQSKQKSISKTQIQNEGSHIAEAYEHVKYFEKQRGKTNHAVIEEGKFHCIFIKKSKILPQNSLANLIKI
jgi:hypothetical protein